MIKNKYLTIGEVSKISGVHIKSLRYYEQIDVLKPAYVDPATGYRYYTYSQLGIVEAIRTCIELDIPLKQFSEYCDNGGQKIHYAKLLDYGKEVAESKVRAIRAGMRLIGELQREIERNETDIEMESLTQYDLPKKQYLMEPFDLALSCEENHTMLTNIYLRAVASGHKPGYDFGLLYFYRNGDIERFRFIDILTAAKGKAKDLTICPAGRYTAKRVHSSRIETAPEEFPELFTASDNKIVVESELITGVYNVEQPQYELRCCLLD